MTALAPHRPPAKSGGDGFGQLLRAEWTKFRTVRGWVIGVFVGVLLTAGLGLLTAGGGQSDCQGQSSQHQGTGSACQPAFIIGPGGEPVNDTFYFVHQPLADNGAVTVRVTSLTGREPSDPADPSSALQPWAKAGLIIKASLTQGSAYAAVLAAAGHGVRMQWNYTGDTAGLPGEVGPANPRWLRLTRAGDVITGYDSADGTHWARVGTVTLTGLPRVAQVGLFAASPDYAQVSADLGGGTSGNGAPAQDTAAFDRLSLSGGWTAGPWSGQFVGGPEVPGAGGYHVAGGRYTVTGQGDIAPIPAGHGGQADSAGTVNDYFIGTFAGLIALVVVAALFITAEYRRGLIRLTLAASPRRGRVLAAKAVVVGAVGFAAGLVGATVAALAGTALTRARGNYVFPLSGLTEARAIVGTALLAALAAVLALAIAVILRRGAAAVTTVIVLIVLPFIVAETIPAAAGEWLLRITPAAGFALQSAYPRYHQVTALYTAVSGYYPLSPLAGLAVLLAWTAVALTAAAYLLRRRDA